MTRSVLITGGTVVTPQGSVEADIGVRDGIIAAIGRGLPRPSDAAVIDAAGLHVLPGVIDPHSHLWEAGFVSNPDFEDSTASAAAGGITTIIDMPLTVPEILDADRFREKAELGERTSHVDFALHAGVSPDRLDELEGMWRAGATAFKIFTCDTGCEMKGVIDDGDLLRALTIIAGFDGLATFHAENEELLVAALDSLRQQGRTDNGAYTAWRSEIAELEAMNRILFYAERTGARVNIVHVTSPDGVDLVRRARQRGVRATAETCPHYLYLTEDDILERGAWVTCAPPMRGPSARDGMRALVASGEVTSVGSDHGPVDPALKRRGSNSILAGQAGMPGNETMTPLMLDLVANRAMTIERLAELTAEAPARLYGLYPRKGAIMIDADADFTIVDPQERWVIRQSELIGKCGWTPYEGREVTGRVAMTVVRGRIVARAGRVAGAPEGASFIPRHQSPAA